MNARASTRLSWVSVCKINMAAFVWARRLNQSSFLGCFLSNLSFVSQSRSFFRLGLYAGDLKSRKQGLLRRDFSTEEVSINFRYHICHNEQYHSWNVKLPYYIDLPRDHFPIYGMDYLTKQQQSPVPQTAMAFFGFPFSVSNKGNRKCLHAVSWGGG